MNFNIYYLASKKFHFKFIKFELCPVLRKSLKKNLKMC